MILNSLPYLTPAVLYLFCGMYLQGALQDIALQLHQPTSLQHSSTLSYYKQICRGQSTFLKNCGRLPVSVAQEMLFLFMCDSHNNLQAREALIDAITQGSLNIDQTVITSLKYLAHTCPYQQSQTMAQWPFSAPIDDQKNYLLHRVAKNIDTHILVPFIIKQSNAINIKNSEGKTPLHNAVLESNEVMIKKLLEHGADARAQDSMNQTPFDYAKRAKKYNFVQLLQLHLAQL